MAPNRTPPARTATLNENSEDASNNAVILELMRELRSEIYALQERLTRIETGNRITTRSEFMDEEPNAAYGRTERDIRHRRSLAPNYVSLKDARTMIPEFDGTSRSKLKEFLNACTYAIQNIDPVEEISLVQAILYTKLKGKAMQDFETREIQTFEELKEQLETCYQTKQSTTHLQIEFNSLKQKNNETAYAYGQRVDLLAMQLYESMIEGEEHSSIFKSAIQQTIKKQALINFEIGLRDELKILVRSQRYATLQEAIAGASTEERLIRPIAKASNARAEEEDPRQDRNTQPKCQRCQRTGHYAKDCRSKIIWPRAEGQPQINTTSKYCKYCKKTGHERDECWSLHGRPENNDAMQRKTNTIQPDRNDAGNKYNHKREDDQESSDSQDSDDDEEESTHLF